MFAKSGKAALAYDVFGAPAGRDVLMIHAGVTDRRSWGPLVAALAPRRCVTYDARGYGETTYDPEPFDAHQDALAVMAAAGLDEAVVVGASMGGRATVDLALEHPERVRGLVLIGPAISGAPQVADDPEPVATFGRRLQAAESAGDLDEVNRLEAHLWLDGPAAPEGRVGGATRDLFLEMNGRALAAADPGDSKAEIDAWGRLETLAMPVLLLVGALDLDEIQDRCATFAARVPGCRQVRLDGVAHLPHLEADPTCLREIASFAAGLDAD